MSDHLPDLREELLADYLPECSEECEGVGIDIHIYGSVLVLACSACGNQLNHVLSEVPDGILKALYADSVEPVEGLN